jgi:RsiW-degrading membrane proteinase PrsW (M82 family)
MQELIQAINQNVLIAAIAAFLPILGWLLFFQYKNKETPEHIIVAFVAGMFSVVPIKLYERYWDIAIFKLQHINIFQYVSDLIAMPEFSTFVAFVIVNVLIGFFIFLFTGAVMMVLELLSGNNSPEVFIRKFGKITESPFIFITVGVLCGFVAYASFITMHQKVWFFVIVGLLEEFTKHLCMRFSSEEHIKNMDDALSYAIIVALGFSFVENIIYLQDFIQKVNPDVAQFGIFYLLRSTVSVIAHFCFSAIFGYFYGLALFSNNIVHNELQQARHSVWHRVHSMFYLKSSLVYHEQKIMEGLLLSMITHAIFNSYLEFNKVHLILPMVLGMFFTLLFLFHRVNIHKRIGTFIRI